MRMIGHLPNEPGARIFGDFLYACGIDNQIEAERDGLWALWVHDEEQLEKAKSLLAEFRRNPSDQKYREARTAAEERRLRAARENESARKRYFDSSKIFPATRLGFGVLTAVLIAISVVVGVLSRGAYSMGDFNQRVIQPLSVTSYSLTGRYLRWTKGLREIREGQVWRVITPIFIHFGPLHLIFNMMWLFDLGTMIERRQGTRLLALLVVVIAATSNLAQYFWRGPDFGGMSGVVYGLIGYIWMRGRFDPRSGLYLHPTTVTMAMIWFVLCLVNVIPNVANTVHAVGLGVGLAWGFLSSQIAGRRN